MMKNKLYPKVNHYVYKNPTIQSGFFGGEREITVIVFNI